jgi:polyferredoxin
MALSKLAANSFDLTDNYALTGTVTGVVSTQKLFLIKNIDASSDSTISFVNGSSSVVLDGTYKTYLFRLINIHPSNNTTTFSVNFRDGGSNYDATKTTTFFAANHLKMIVLLV